MKFTVYFNTEKTFLEMKDILLKALGPHINISFQDNGKTVEPWIKTEDRLPEKEYYEFIKKYALEENNGFEDDFEVIAKIEGALEPTTLYYHPEKGLFDSRDTVYEVELWMPLPNLPE